MTEEFGPWVDHHGRGRPVPKGTVVEVESVSMFGSRRTTVAIAMADKGSAWDWESGLVWLVDRYRVRRPRGMAVLDAILANSQENVPA